MKRTVLAGLLAWVVTVHCPGQASIPVPAAVWHNYLRLGSNITTLQTVQRSNDLAYSSWSKKLELQRQAGKISAEVWSQTKNRRSRHDEAARRANKQAIAAMELDRLIIKERYKITVADNKPAPALKSGRK